MLKDLKDKQLWKSCGIVFLLMLIFFLPVLINNRGVLIFYGDSYEQFYQYYLGGWEKFRTLDFSDWNWSLGLGANGYSYALYFPTSIFFYLTLLFPKEWMHYEFLGLQMLRILCCFVFAYLWSKKLVKKNLSRFVMASMVAFSGWVFFYLHYNYFVEGYLLFPLVFYFTEVYLQNHNYKGLVLSCFFLTFTSFYFMYMLVPFVCLYALYRYLVLNENNLKLNTILIEACKYFGFVLLGIGLCGFLLLPSAYALLGNPRLDGEKLSMFQHITKVDCFKFLTSLLTPVFSRIDPDFFVGVEEVSDLGWGYGCSLFSLLIGTFSLFNLAHFLKKFEIQLLFGLYGICFIFLLFPSFWILFQQTVDTRWVFIFVLLNAYSAGYLLEHDEWKRYWKGIVAVLLLMAGCFVISYLLGLRDTSSLKQLLFVLALEVPILLLYLYGFMKQKSRWVMLGVCTEILFSGLVFITYNTPREYTLFESDLKNRDVINEIENDSTEFSRIIYEDDYYSTPNEPLSKNYPGFAFYHSVYNFEQEEYLNRFKSKWSMPMIQGRTNSFNMMAVNYFYTISYRAPAGFEYLYDVGRFHVYINKYASTLAHLNEKTVQKSYFEELSYLNQDRLLLDYVVTEDSTNTNVYFSDEIVYLNSALTSEGLTWTSPEMLDGKTLIIECEYMPSVTVELLRKNEFVDAYSFAQNHYFEITIPEGWNVDGVRIIFNEPSSESFSLYLKDYHSDNYRKWYHEKKENMISNIMVYGDRVAMSVLSGQSQYVVTSIPYDRGWTLTINGNPHDIEKVNLGFIGFSIDEGSYEIVLTYSAPWKKEGVALSGLALIIFGVLNYCSKKRNLTI